MSDADRRSRVWTIPNAISLARLACVPVFLWLYIAEEEALAAAVLLAVLGATDWIDGWIARRYDQGSELGKVLDPVADRILLLAAVIALLVEGDVPVWVGVLILAREALVSIAVLVLAALGARRIDVQWAGKAGTLCLMFALPAFVVSERWSFATGFTTLAAWCFTITGLVFGYWAAAQYVPLARRSLAEGRAERHAEEAVGT